MPIDLSSHMDTSAWDSLTMSSAGGVVSTGDGTSSFDGIVATSAGLSSVSSNGIDLVALSAKALIDEASEVTGLDEDVDLESAVSELSPTALSGLLDSTSDSAVLNAFFGNTDVDALLTSVVSSSSRG